ncbi:MAG: penicillin-binding protein 2 [Eggerthellaceae bacterium]|nr:penicillin-binding protein 2 [Eggerthellaceae bacterium]
MIFFARLIFLQVLVAPTYTAMAEESRTINFPVTPKRGTIYDRNGQILAVSVDCTTIYCNPSEVTDARHEASMISTVLEEDADHYEALLSREPSTFVYIERQADLEKAERLKEMKLPGIYFIADSRREYPNGGVGGQVIGVCDVDGNGITGLELQYDELLRGTPGKYSAERGEKGAPIPGGVHEDTPAKDGEDIMISLDIRLQTKMEEALEKGVLSYEGEQGSSVMIDGDTGEIYAICSYPYLDPTDREHSMVGSDNLTAITQAIEPGSIFKSLSALTVLHERAKEPEDIIFCPAELEADQYVITDAHKRPDVDMTFATILNQSSNVGISLATQEAGFDKLNDMIERLKIAEKTGVDYPGEAQNYVQDFDEWAYVTGCNISFGQGLTTTPLTMARFYGMLASDGLLCTPHFLMSKPQTGEWEEYPSEQVIDDQEALDKLKGMLQGVVIEGTGTDAEIEGYDVAGKTSTAQIAENGGYAENRYNLCFAGFIDNSNSNLACFVSANNINYEGKMASVFHDIMLEAIDLYNIVPVK